MKSIAGCVMWRVCVSVSVLIALGSRAVLAQSFPSYADEHEPPPGWTGPIFKLSQNYPKNLQAQTFPWQSIDFKTQPLEYLTSVLHYCFAGNTSTDWQGDQNPVRKWYHAPWLHAGPTGRECVHGLTQERISRPGELHPHQSEPAQNWAVSMYNEPGGYTIGQFWEDPLHPDPSKALFPEGTVSVKLLFTEAPVSQVPYLKGSIEWDAHINETIDPKSRRTIKKMRLLQMDVSVRDARADDTTGWVLGTFIYDAENEGGSAWDRMVPIGLMWGNDPGLTPAAGAKPTQTWINPSLRIPQHLGWAGRLNGPVDNPRSSCLSCHSTAQTPATVPMIPRESESDETKLRWFRNIKAGEPFDAESKSLDYSLQLAIGLRNFEDSRRTKTRGLRSAIKSPAEFPIMREGEEDEEWLRQQLLHYIKKR